MINKNYIIKVENKPGSDYNPTHEMVDGNYAVLLEAEIGSRGWIAYRLDDNDISWHRLHTSNIESVEDLGYEIKIVTEHTIYHLKRVPENN